MQGCSRERGGIVGALLAIVVLGVVLLAVAVYLGVHVARSVSVESSETEKGETVKVKTPFGNVRVDGRSKVDARSVGIPVYPSAQLVEHGGKAASISLDFGDELKELTIVGAVYKTGDSVEQVRAYYREHLPNWIVTDKGFEFHEGGHKRVIAVHRKHGETHIAVASVGEPASN